MSRGRLLVCVVAAVVGIAVALLCHRPGLLDDPRLATEIERTVRLGLEHERLHAELRRQLAHLRRSRADVAAAGEAERRLLERDLHDGAQQRLAALAFALGVARQHAAPERAAALERAQGEVQEALAELRELAHGLYPVALADAGLAAAIESLSDRRPELRAADLPTERFAPAIEEAAYLAPGHRSTHARIPARRGHRHRGPPGGARRLARRDASCAERTDPRDRGTAVRVIVADDEVLLREGLARLLAEAGFEVAGKAGDAAELLRLVESRRPDLVVVDIKMPPTHTDEGFAAAREIGERAPGIGVLVLSHYLEPRYAMRLLEQHPERAGYLLKDRVSDVAVLADALRRISDGECVIDPTIVSRLVARRRSGPWRSSPSARCSR